LKPSIVPEAVSNWIQQISAEDESLLIGRLLSSLTFDSWQARRRDTEGGNYALNYRLEAILEQKCNGFICVLTEVLPICNVGGAMA